MKIVISPDSFKGSLTSYEVATIISRTIKKINDSIETICLPIADGGEGTLDALIQATDGEYLTTVVQNPLGKNVEATFGILGDGETCLIEMAKASGLTLINEDEKNPRFATTYGTGQLITRALNLGYRKFIIGIGGSATNDGGLGLLRALGMKFYSHDGSEITSDVWQLNSLKQIETKNFDERIEQSTFIVACDVNNPLVGPNGATTIFGPQKGVKQEEIQLFDDSLKMYGLKIEEHTQMALQNCAGAGAAGGIGAAFMAFFPSQFKRGIDVVLDAVEFTKHIQHADFVITGEGRSDMQTLSGKAPIGVATLAKEGGVPTILLSGSVEMSSVPLLKEFFIHVESIVNKDVSLEKSITRPAYYLEKKVEQLVNKFI
ncbi:MAG: glycerate kinase [Solibacillus sp.]|uniref:glycerate kinase n=1 Tax=unclassified Solibacillus TaxID=2637870 RepID=UPI0030F4C6B3